jgi:hypothetical protein
MNENDVSDEWFCYECRIKVPPATGAKPGPFDALVANLERKNARSFRLTAEIRDYFEGVKTGPDGEYEEDKPKLAK